MATLPTTPENATRITQHPDARRRSPPTGSGRPALTLSAVWPTDPRPAGPGSSPAAMLPAPWAMKSWFGVRPRAVRVRRRLGHAGALHEHDRGDRERAARATTNEKSPRSRKRGQRDPAWGSRRRRRPCATPSSPSSDHDDGRHDQGDQRAYDGEPGAAQHDDDARARRGRRAARPSSISPGWVSDVRRLARARSPPSAGAPVRSASWPKMMLTATPVRNPIITECERNGCSARGGGCRRATIADAGHEREQEQRRRAVGRIDARHRRSGGERGRARGRDDHQLRAGVEARRRSARRSCA